MNTRADYRPGRHAVAWVARAGVAPTACLGGVPCHLGHLSLRNQKDSHVTSHEWGRVADDGTVFVRTPDGERPVGQYPEGTPEEALGFYVDRYAALETEVGLLEQRVRAGKLSPDEATTRVKAVRAQVLEANAVGDLQ